MLEADKAALERDLAKQMASLQVKELQYLHTNFQNLAVTCALLVGFGFTGLGLFKGSDLDTNYQLLRCTGVTLGFDFSREPPISHSECRRTILAWIVELCWSASCALGLTWNLLALFIATVSSITGPGMALRGPEGSLGVALAHMELQNKRALRFFGRGLVAFSLSVVGFGLQAAATLGLVKGIILVFIGGFTIYQLQMYGREIGSHFHLTLGRTVFSPASGGFWAQSRSERVGEVGTAGESAESGDSSGAYKGAAASVGTGEGAIHQGASNAAVKKGRCHCCWRPLPALPSGQKAYTALWRLDKLVVVPYHEQYADAFGVRNEEALHAKARLGAQAQRHTLIQALQGPTSAGVDEDSMQAFEGVGSLHGEQDVLRATLDSVARFNSSLPWNREQEAGKASPPTGEWWANVFGRRKIGAQQLLPDAASQSHDRAVADIEAASSSQLAAPPGKSAGGSASGVTDARSV